MKGDIAKGDAEKFESVMQELNRNGLRVARLALLSRGGNVSDAIKIGRAVRKYIIFTSAPPELEFLLPPPENFESMTTDELFAFAKAASKIKFKYFETTTLNDVRISSSRRAVDLTNSSDKSLIYDPDAMCASACALIAVAGLHRSGTVGVHHMYVEDREIDFNDLNSVLGNGADEVQGYLAELRIPMSFWDRMNSTPSNEMTWIDFGREDGVDNYDPFLQEYLHGKCGGLTDRQDVDLSNLSSRQGIGRHITSEEQRYLEELQRISDEFNKCRVGLISAAQRKAQGLD
jgi:hypothetical protein